MVRAGQIDCRSGWREISEKVHARPGLRTGDEENKADAR
jgi:hypothetical protein